MPFLERIDAVPFFADDLSPELESWLSVLVDTLNENLADTQDAINGEADASYISRKTSAEITALLDRNRLPVITNGLWIDTTLGKLRFVVTPAVPGISDGATETVVSAP
jgi:hypothetical protein